MGYERVQGRFSALLSRHNSARDREDDALWNEFVQRVRELAGEDKYKAIMPDMDADEVEEAGD
jgi:hypothetical protein